MTKPYQDPEILREMYWGKDMSGIEIADELGCHDTTIYNYMDEYGIDRRSKTEASTIRGLKARPWIGTGPNGYVVCQTSSRGDRSAFKMHRLLAVSEFGFGSVSGMDVHHKNEIPWDNRPDNLELMDTSAHQRHHKNRLTWLDRLRIAEMYRNGDCGQRTIASQFGVSQKAVWDVLNGNGGSNVQVGQIPLYDYQ